MLPICCSFGGNSGNWSDRSKQGLEFDSGNFPTRPKNDRLQFAKYMFAIYNKVAALRLSNFIGTKIPVLTNLNIKAWAQIAVTPQQCQVIEFLT